MEGYCYIFVISLSLALGVKRSYNFKSLTRLTPEIDNFLGLIKAHRMDKENVTFKKKEDFICWKDYVTLLIESKELYEVLEKDIETTKPQNAKALTIMKKHMDFSLHHILHGIRDPIEALDVLGKYSIDKKEVKLLQLQNDLDKPEGRVFLEKINHFNTFLNAGWTNAGKKGNLQTLQFSSGHD
eukprot:snap_masked-scaffold_5-processed-gene-15.15-mRNA-1 protein AED:1.00 eAED:1.00 QI:0/0/0/0/1/1/3/0/183